MAIQTLVARVIVHGYNLPEMIKKYRESHSGIEFREISVFSRTHKKYLVRQTNLGMPSETLKYIVDPFGVDIESYEKTTIENKDIVERRVRQHASQLVSFLAQESKVYSVDLQEFKLIKT